MSPSVKLGLPLCGATLALTALLTGCAAGVLAEDDSSQPGPAWTEDEPGDDLGGWSSPAGEPTVDDWQPVAPPSGEELGCVEELTATIRDFRVAHPDFETYTGNDAYGGLVQPHLGLDDKPLYAHPHGTPQTTGPSEFAQWYHDVDGVNETVTVSLPLVETSPGVFAYDHDAFFPVDGQAFGEEGNPHNFHFTTEIHTAFLYQGGESFTFTGDDDLWLFINGQLAIDLGGLHPQLSATVDLDTKADELGLEPGEVYSMDIFHAERHTPESNFHIETTIHCFDTVPR